MKQEIEIICYNSNDGLRLCWESDFSIKVCVENNETFICANREGLMSLAKHCLTLAQNSVPVGTHIHLDEYNGLEDNSAELIIVKAN